MKKITPNATLIAAIKNVNPIERKNAMIVAERLVNENFTKLTAFNDFDEATNIEMAMDSAASEITYCFA